MKQIANSQKVNEDDLIFVEITITHKGKTIHQQLSTAVLNSKSTKQNIKHANDLLNTACKYCKITSL